jgi:hypothetical protein
MCKRGFDAPGGPMMRKVKVRVQITLTGETLQTGLSLVELEERAVAEALASIHDSAKRAGIKVHVDTIEADAVGPGGEIR